ncbi:hypothetical protein LP420_01050 [Massilia sp. B-10]|nr:hypothetical protein LP420_01050 [Massilia sp. B-10]
MLAQAAVAGQGIALVAYGIAFQDILKGSLRKINCRSAPFGSGYRFLVNPAQASHAQSPTLPRLAGRRNERHATRPRLKTSIRVRPQF